MTQSDFCAALLDPTVPIPPGILANRGTASNRRFDVHRNNVAMALVDALADTFDVVRMWVGDDFFRAMAREFCRLQPPRSPVLAEYGAEFPSFIEQFPPASSLPYLADVARLEWNRQSALHAADAPSIDVAAVSALLASPESLLNSRWALHASVAVLESSYAIVSLWAAHQHDNDEARSNALWNLNLSTAESALVLRQNREVLVMNLTPSESAFVAELQRGAPLEIAVKSAQERSDAFDLTLAFSILLRSSALVAVL